MNARALIAGLVVVTSGEAAAKTWDVQGYRLDVGAYVAERFFLPPGDFAFGRVAERIWIGGTDPRRWVALRLQTENALHDAVLDEGTVTLLPRARVELTAGRMKVPFLQQDLTSSTRRHLVGPGLVSGAFGRSSDDGVEVRATLSQVARLRLFTFAGAGAPYAGARLAFVLAGEDTATVADLRVSRHLGLRTGMALAARPGRHDSRVTVDAALRWRRLSVAVAALLAVATPVAWACQAEAAYVVWPGRLASAARVTASDRTDEQTLGLTLAFADGVRVQANVIHETSGATLSAVQASILF